MKIVLCLLIGWLLLPSQSVWSAAKAHSRQQAGNLVLRVADNGAVRIAHGKWHDLQPGKILRWKHLRPGKYRVDAVLGGKAWSRNVPVFNEITTSILVSFLPHRGADWLIDVGHGRSMLLKWVPPGDFLLGSGARERDWAASPDGMCDAEWFDNEGDKPRRCRIKSGFWLGMTEVTRGQWKVFVADTGYKTAAEKNGKAICMKDEGGWDWVKGKSWRDPNWAKGVTLTDKIPVVCVNWNDVNVFCRWLTARERKAGRLPKGYEYRLPGEAEWEYACRAGAADGDMFWWGDSIMGGRGRINGAGSESLRLPGGRVVESTKHYYWDDHYGWGAPVCSYGKKGLNGFGLSDMVGNVWEWCYDCYDSRGAHMEINRSGDQGRVLRGGSFGNYPGELRCAFRRGDFPTVSSACLGFRVCLAKVVGDKTKR